MTYLKPLWSFFSSFFKQLLVNIPTHVHVYKYSSRAGKNYKKKSHQQMRQNGKKKRQSSASKMPTLSRDLKLLEMKSSALIFKMHILEFNITSLLNQSHSA